MSVVKTLALATAVLLVGGVQPAQAVTYVATETIEDIELNLFGRNLRRTITDSTGTSVTNSDSAIETLNAIDDDFGIYNDDTVTYRHNLLGITPTPGSYLSASLTIEAFGVDGRNDSVSVETINFGVLNNDGVPILEFFTTSIFSSFTPVQLSLLLADGYLNVSINKSNGDPISVTGSKFSVSYDAGSTTVPEPASALLLGTAGLFLARRRRKAA